MTGSRDEGRGRTSRSSMIVWAGAAALMLLPVLAIRSGRPSAWDLPGDAIFLAILLGATGLAWEVTVRVPRRHAYWAAVAIALGCGLLSAWINLAVGIIGSEDNPANGLYAGVLVVAAAGALLARLRSPGMARAMIAAAIAQALAFVIALASGLGFTGPITVFFTALWLMSAWLFRKAAQP